MSPYAKDKLSVPFPFWPGNVDVVAIPVVPEASTVGKTGPWKLRSLGVSLIKILCLLRQKADLVTFYKQPPQNMQPTD